MSADPLKIANAQAFWGDRNDAASELLTQVPDLDYLTLDYLAEVSLSILAQQRNRDPQAGYPLDFLEVFSSLIPYWRAGGKCRLITNAGGLNPVACAAACAARLAAENGRPLNRAGKEIGHNKCCEQARTTLRWSFIEPSEKPLATRNSSSLSTTICSSSVG